MSLFPASRSKIPAGNCFFEAKYKHSYQTLHKGMREQFVQDIDASIATVPGISAHIKLPAMMVLCRYDIRARSCFL